MLCIFRRRAWVVAFLLLVFVSVAPGIDDYEQGFDQVLLLHSYHRGLDWTDEISAGVETVFEELPNVELQIVHMDTKRVSDEDYFQGLYEYYKQRFRHTQFKAVICSDDHAFTFLIDRHEQLFPGVPVVFCGVNFFSEDRVADHPEFTGVVEAFDIRSTLEAAAKLHPKATELVVINDHTATGKANRKVLDRVLPDFLERFTVRYLSDHPMRDLQKEVAALPNDALVLLMSYTRDAEGKVFSYDESIAHIRRMCNVPIYGVWDFYLGHGIVGGKLTSGFDQGRTAARMALLILQGAKPSEMPVVTDSPNRYMFDYAEMARFGVRISDLPPGSKVINRPPTFFQLRKRLVWSMVAVLGLLAVAVLVLLVDRYERRRADEVIQQEHEIFAGGPVILFKWQAKANWPVEYVSKNVNQLGYQPDDFVSGRMAYIKIVHPEDVKRVSEEVERYTAAGVPYFEQHYRIIDARGEVRWVYDITRIIRHHDKVTHYHGYVLDITRRRIAEERERDLKSQLSRAERLKSLGELAGGVAHDLNNILGPLVGYPDLILRSIPDDSPVRSCVNDIKYSARRAATVIQDLLTLARRGSFELRPVNMNETVRSYLDSGAFRSIRDQQPQVKLQTYLEDGLPLISGSPSHLSRVLMNLVLNGYEAIAGSGALTITTRSMYLDRPVSGHDTVEEGEYVVLSVKDTGCGMTPAEVERIFDPFYTKRKMGRSGTGLGLAVVYGVIQDHLGYIEVKTAPGRGSEFLLYFPASGEGAAEEQETASPQGGTESVLVVDDRSDQLDLCKQMLASLGYRVATAEGGRKAIEYLKDNPVDLVMLDMIMEEDFDGLDTYRAVVQMYPEQACVITSGYAETDRVHKAMDLGAGTYLRKPYTLLHLDQAIREELERRRKS